jgi:hypothetical protein
MIKCFGQFASKIIMFQEVVQFKEVIILSYIKPNTININGKVPPFLTWHIQKIILDSFLPPMNACVLSQFNSHLLVSNA